MNDSLQSTLRAHLSHWQSNPAMKTLIDDYAKYHLVLVLTGGFLVVLLALLSIASWVQCRRIPSKSRFRWPFEKKAYFCFGLLGSFVTLLFALIVVANATNAFNPLPGFSILVNSLATPSSSSVGQAVSGWVQSGSSTIPPIVTQQVNDRLAWQRPKAIVCSILFVLCAALGVFLWSTLMRKRRASGAKWRPAEVALATTGVVIIPITLVLMVMAVANTQAAIAPIAITVLGANG